MAYMRGSFYLWQDGANVHIWSRNGYDGWDESVWNQPDDSIVGGDNPASGIAIPLEIADEFVAMRVAQLLDERRLSEVIDRAIHKWQGNGGCDSLMHLQNRMKGIESGNK